ncbi:efflux RND transporter permease subunit [Undibacterium arcticum]
MNVIEPFVRRPVMTGLIMLSILIFGIVAYRSLPVSDLPNVDFSDHPGQCDATGGASSETMAAAVATPLEKAVFDDRSAGLDELGQCARVDPDHAAVFRLIATLTPRLSTSNRKSPQHCACCRRK